MVGNDPLFGPCLAVVYRNEQTRKNKKSPISTLLMSRHGTSGFLNITIGPKSRYHCASRNLPEEHRNSVVRQALAITCLRSFATMNPDTRESLTKSLRKETLVDWDETMAGSMAARMKLADGKYPEEIGKLIIDGGFIEPRLVKSTTVDVIYEDSDTTIDKNNELVYLLGDQMEQLFDPLAEYSPESTELSYSPPKDSYATLQDDPEQVRVVCEELFALQANLRSELIDFLQDFLIPLRVKVLGGEIPNLNIRKLNSIFPPTIDEIVRINNIFYDALRQAYPFGSFEILRACGMTIPYFYKASMRHEAATKGFSRTFNYHYERTFGGFKTKKSATYTPRKIESIIHISIHLTKVKMVLDRLIKAKKWPADQQIYVTEFYNSAVGTIDAFGKEDSVAPYNRRIFTPTGKILVEIATGWPRELEYGWVNRRVVTIFDAKDVASSDQEPHHIIILFTDYLVILRPTEPIALVSASGLHKPSIADILMHALVNESPVQSLPELEVIKWSDISNTHFAEYSMSRNLAIYSSNKGLQTQQGPNQYVQVYQLIRRDYSASKMVELLAKAKIMNKTQPFHLFKIAKPELSVYTPVHELAAYAQEIRKTPIAIFLNVDVTQEVLIANDLKASFKVEFVNSTAVTITLYSQLGYEFEKTVPKAEFNFTLTSELAHIYTLYLSSNQSIAINEAMITTLIAYATSPSTKSLTRRRTPTPGGRHVSFPPAVEPIEEEEQGPIKRQGSPEELTKNMAVKDSKSKKRPFRFIRVKERSPAIEMNPAVDEQQGSSPRPTSITKLTVKGSVKILPELTRISTPKSAPPTFEFPVRATPTPEPETLPVPEPEPERVHRSVKSFNELRARRRNIASDDEDCADWEDVSEFSPTPSATPHSRNESSIASALTIAPNSPPSSFEDLELTSESDLDEQQHQRDVSAWYHSIKGEDSESLNTDLSLNDEVGRHNEDEEDEDRWRTQSVKQLGRGFGSQTFEFPPIKPAVKTVADRINPAKTRQKQTSEGTEDITNNTIDTINFEEDFAYLAGLVGDEDTNTGINGTAAGLELSPSNGRLYPDLRDTSIAFLGSYVRSSSQEIAVKQEQDTTIQDVIDLEVLQNDVNTGTPSESEWMSTTFSRSSSERRRASGSTIMTTTTEVDHAHSTSSGKKKLAITSSTSFSRMITDASSNTLQLASFTVHLDRLVDEKLESPAREDQLVVRELIRVKCGVVALYQRTRQLTLSRLGQGGLGTGGAELAREIVYLQQAAAKHAACLVFTVLGLMDREQISSNKPRYINIAYALLDLEWLRRNKLVEGLGDSVPLGLFGWTTSSPTISFC